jgi:hypothetical protein
VAVEVLLASLGWGGLEKDAGQGCEQDSQDWEGFRHGLGRWMVQPPTFACHGQALAAPGRQSWDPHRDQPMTPAPNTVLASSAGWVAVLLNLVPGLGTGYIYQRRWKAYWISSAITTSWFVLGAVLGQDQPSADLQRNQAIGLAGLVLVAAITAMEAGLATRRSRQG